MNKVILMGRLTRDPDIRYSGSGDQSLCIARFTLAVDRRFTSQDGQREADFISCVAFGRQADFVAKYLHQGTKIALNGRIQTGSYTNRDGQKVYTTDVVAEDLEFAESKASADGRQGQSYQPNYQNQRPQNTYQPRPQETSQQMPVMPVPEAPKEQPVNDGFQMPGETEYANEGFDEVGRGFMNIPEGVEDDSLPFN